MKLMALPSVLLWNILEWIVRCLVLACFSFAKPGLGLWQFLVGDMREQVADQVQAKSFLVLGFGDIPGRPRSVGRLEHFIPGPGVVIP